MENKKLNEDLKKLPLIFSITDITFKNNIKLELRKVKSNLKYRTEQYPVFSHFKSIIRF